MKKIIIIFLALVLVVPLFSQEGSNLINKNESQRNINYHVLFMTYFNLIEEPNGSIGIELAVGGKWCGYVSGGYSIYYKELSFLTAGVIGHLKEYNGIYFGIGLLPKAHGYAYTYFPYGIETGPTFTYKFISVMTGLGLPIIEKEIGWGTVDYSYFSPETIYAKLGIGVNF